MNESNWGDRRHEVFEKLTLHSIRANCSHKLKFVQLVVLDYDLELNVGS